MNVEDIQAIVAPSSEKQMAVVNWLVENKVSKVMSYGDAIEGFATVGVLEQMLSTKFYRYSHEDGCIPFD